MNVSAVGTINMSPSAYTGAERVISENGSGSEAVAAATLSTNGAASETVSDAELIRIMEAPIKQANKSLQPYDRYIMREIHEVTKAMMYKIKDTKTNEVIAEYPPREIQDMLAKMWEMAGLLLDQKG